MKRKEAYRIVMNDFAQLWVEAKDTGHQDVADCIYRIGQQLEMTCKGFLKAEAELADLTKVKTNVPSASA